MWFYCWCYWVILSPMNPNRNIPPPLSVSTLNVIKKTNNDYYACKTKAKWTTKSRQKYNLGLKSILIARTSNVKVEAKIMRTLMLLTSLIWIQNGAFNLISSTLFDCQSGKILPKVEIGSRKAFLSKHTLNWIDKKCVSYLIDQNEIST